jgi:hypothetical protein
MKKWKAQIQIPPISASDFTLLSHSLLIGASPLIPVPFLDDVLTGYLWRRMVAELARIEGRQLTKTEIGQLSNMGGRSFSGGCIAAVVYLFAQLLRELRFWREWQRGIDLATQAYYSGFLLREVFKSESFDPAHALRYGKAIQRARAGLNTRLIKNVMADTFKSSKGMLLAMAAWLYRQSRDYLKLTFSSLWARVKARWSRSGDQPAPEAVMDETTRRKFDWSFENIGPDIKRSIEGAVASLQAGLGKLSEDHFNNMRTNLLLELQREGLV